MKLFDPIRIREVTLKNRTYMLSMGSPGQFGDIAIDYYVARAKGGVAAITSGWVNTWEEVLDNIEAMRPFTEAVHNAAPDCRLAIQPAPWGRDRHFSPSGPLYSATYNSLVWGPMEPIEPVAMTKDEIKWYVESLAESAYRQKQVGFDYVELHGTHAYLFRQFFAIIVDYWRQAEPVEDAARRKQIADFRQAYNSHILDDDPAGQTSIATYGREQALRYFENVTFL